MQTTMNLSQSFGCSPFELLKQDCDEVIMIINYYIELGENQPNENNISSTKNTVEKTQQRIKVNDETATGGWY